MTSEILGLFANRLTADGKYSLPSSENLPQLSEMQLSKKEKVFSQFSAYFLKFTLEFEHFEKNDDSHSLCISKIRIWERAG